MTKELRIEYNQLKQDKTIVTFLASKRAKYTRISINSQLQIKVIFPKYSSINNAREFFNSRINWVKNSLIKLQAKQIAMNNNSNQLKKKLSAEEFLSRNQYLIKRCHELAQKHKLTIGKVTLRRQKTVWGSCSAKNNISLNSNLVFLDDELIDYVILHELAHTKVKNHSRNFWKTLEQFLPGAKLLDKKLKNYRPDFYRKSIGT